MADTAYVRAWALRAGIPAALAVSCTVVVGARAQSGAHAARQGEPAARRQDHAPASATSKTGPQYWDIASETGDYMDATGETRFTNVTATSDQDTVVHADLWLGNEKTKTAHATGNLKMTDTRADVTALAADVNYAKGKRLLVLSGDVVMFVKPKKDAAAPAPPPPGPAPVTVRNGKAVVQDAAPGDEDSSQAARKYPVTVTCDRIEYEYARNKKHAILTGHFKAVQKLPDNVRTLTADHAEWFGLEDRMVLYPHVHAEDTKDLRSFDSDEPATIYMKEGEERVSFKHATVKYRAPDEEEGGPGEAEAAPTKPGSPASSAKGGKP